MYPPDLTAEDGTTIQAVDSSVTQTDMARPSTRRWRRGVSDKKYIHLPRTAPLFSEVGRPGRGAAFGLPPLLYASDLRTIFTPDNHIPFALGVPKRHLNANLVTSPWEPFDTCYDTEFSRRHIQHPFVKRGVTSISSLALSKYIFHNGTVVSRLRIGVRYH